MVVVVFCTDCVSLSSIYHMPPGSGSVTVGKKQKPCNGFALQINERKIRHNKDR